MIVAIILATFIGWPLAVAVDRRGLAARLLGGAFLLGMAICSLVLFALSLFGIPWTRTAIVGVAVLAAGGWRFAVRRRQSGRNEPPIANREPRQFLLLLPVLILLAGYATFATIAPLWENDFVSNWGMKGRAFFESGGIAWPVLETALHHDAHPRYPILLPLSFDVLAVMEGEWDDRQLGLLYVAFASSLLLIVFGTARAELESDLAAAVVTFALIPFAASPWIGMGEGPFAAYATTAVLFLREALQRDDARAVTAGALFAGLAASVKEEGLPLLVAISIALALARRGRWIVRLWPAVAVILPWSIVRLMRDLPTMGSAARETIVERLLHPIDIVAAIAASPVGKPLYWIGVLIAIALGRAELWRRERFVFTVLALQACAYVAAYVVSPFEVERIKWSWERLITHLTPALTFVLLVYLMRSIRPPNESPA